MLGFKRLNNKLKVLFLITSILGLGGFLSNYSRLQEYIFSTTYSLIGDEINIEFLKKYFLPYRLISQQKQKLDKQELFLDSIIPFVHNMELLKKDLGTDIETISTEVNLDQNKILKKYKLTSGFYTGIKKSFPGSGYIDFYQNDFFVLSSRGILAFKKNLNADKENFKQIKNNINKYINDEQYNKSNKFSLKDLLIFKEKIFISFTEEILEDCWSTSLLYGNINYKKINFEKLFSSKECVNSIKNIDNEFEANQSGGRIVPFDNENILLSVGDYRNRHLAQNENSIFGKLLKINFKNGDYKIISMGHRNPQGLYVDFDNNIILETEHGPAGGDEINLIEIKKISNDNIQNYGWPVVSAGEHYGGRKEKNEKKYKKYPLHKSHKKFGFIPPLKSFVPSIGISEIIKIGNNKFVVSSLKDKSLFFFKLNDKNKVVNLERLEVFERIRDLKFKDKKLYLFLEDTSSIGILDLKEY